MYLTAHRRCFVLVWTLLAYACCSGCSSFVGSEQPRQPAVVAAPLPAVTLTPQAWADAQVQLAALPTPAGVDAAAFSQLRAQLALLLEAQAAKATSALPNQTRNVIEDIALTGDPATALTLAWSYKNVGDYSNDGEVNISDLQPIGVHLGKNSASPDWDAARTADGDANGEVTIGDLTPIGQNLFAAVSGYRIYSAADSVGPWTLVDSLDMSEATAGFPRRFSFNLPQPLAAHYTIAPFDPAGNDAINSLGVVTPSPGATLQLGTFTEVASATVGTSGGTLTGAVGTPLEGYSVDILAGAFEGNVDIALGYNDGTVTPAVGTQHGPIIEINTNFDGNIGFAEPIVITVPVTLAADECAAPYYINPDGTLELCTVTALDGAAGTVTFETWHASSFAVLKAIANDPLADQADTHFDPVQHGFQVTGGGVGKRGVLCFADWHYRSRRAPLYPRFMQTIQGATLGQHLISQRAAAAVQLAISNQDAVNQRDSVGTLAKWGLLRSAIRNSGGPVELWLYDEQDEVTSVLAYAFVGNDVFAYDPDLPGNTTQYAWDPALENFTFYDNFIVFGHGSFAHREPFTNILKDAEAGFHGSSDTVLDLGTLRHGDIILGSNLNINAVVGSGAVLVDEISVTVQPSGAVVEKLVPIGGQLTLSVPLQTGDNFLTFRTFGRGSLSSTVETKHNLRNLPLLVVSQSSTDPPLMRMELAPLDPQSVDEERGTFDLYVKYTDNQGGGDHYFNGHEGASSFMGMTFTPGETTTLTVDSSYPYQTGGVSVQIHRTDSGSKWARWSLQTFHHGNTTPNVDTFGVIMDTSPADFSANWTSSLFEREPGWTIAFSGDAWQKN